MLTPSARELELRTRIEEGNRNLEERAEAWAEGLRPESADEVAETLIRIRMELDMRELEAEVAARARRPLLVSAWTAASLAGGIGVATGHGLAVLTALGLFAIAHGPVLRRSKRIPSPAGYVHPQFTPARAYRLAGEDERFTRAVLNSMYGKEYVDGLYEDIERLDMESAEVVVQPVVFREGEHAGLLEQEVHEIAAETLAMRVRNMDDAWPALRFHILYGAAGRGKSTLVKVLAQEIRDRLVELGRAPGLFVEAFGGDLAKAKKLDAKIRLANSVPGSVLFIDEIHAIPPEIAERMYMMTDRDFRYQFDGDDFPTQLNPITVVGATTDLGKLHPALRSRAERVPLELVPPEKLVAIALGMPYSVEPDAAQLVVSRVQWDGMPRAVVSLLEFAREFSKAAGHDGVRICDVEEAIRVRRLDEWGLEPFHRDVVRALAKSPTVVGRGTKGERTVHKLAEATLLAMSKVDAGLYRDELRPALMDRGFLVATSGGQQLTDAGLAYATRQGLA